MSERRERPTDTFIDAFGRCHLAGQEVPQPVYERYQRLWFDCAAIIAQLWRCAAFPNVQRDRTALFDPPLTEDQTALLNEATEEWYEAFVRDRPMFGRTTTMTDQETGERSGR